MVQKKKTAAAKAARKVIAKPPAKIRESKSNKSKSGKSKSSGSKPDPLDDLIEAGARTLALTIAPAWKPAVRANLHVIFSQAALFTAFELPDDAEPAPIFTA
jgi:hypothetical protein